MSRPEPKFHGFSKADIERALLYDRVSGVFTRAVDGHGAWKAGQRAGSINGQGYVVLRLGKAKMLAHRLAWFLETGTAPPEVEHKNRKRNDNRIANLRAATHVQNMANATARKGGSSRHKGVYFSTARGCFRVQICRDGKRIYLGSFADEDEAGKAYDAAARKHSGSFAHTNFP